MPTNPVSAGNMGVGKKRGGKHWTKAEVEARQAAAEGLRRDGRAMLRMPKWLTPEAQEIWRWVKRETKGLELLDNLDTDLLAIYCDALAKYRATSAAPVLDAEQVKALQAWARLVAQYADKLGFSPLARARLAKKKAAEEPPDPMEQLLGEVTEYVNRPRDER